MRLVHWVITVPIALVLVIFAVSNREEVTVLFWPVPVTLGAPLYLVVLLALLLGFLLGELVAWINGRFARRQAREHGRRVAALERELTATQAQLSAATQPRPPASLPQSPSD